MGDGATLEETAAGQEVYAEIEKQEKEFENQLRELAKTWSKPILNREELEEMMAEVREEQRQAIENERKLAADREELRRQKEEEDRKERQKFTEDMARMQKEIAEGEYAIKLMQQRHSFELRNQRSEFEAFQARADIIKAGNELERRERERKKRGGRMG
jgi:hypothetical protein